MKRQCTPQTATQLSATTITPPLSLFRVMVKCGLLLVFVAACFQSNVSVATAASGSPPNIIFIFADDLAANATAFGGNPQVKTPHLDRLAAEGVVFDNAYNQGGWHGAICVASRSMLNTGRFLWNAKKFLEPTGNEPKTDTDTLVSHFWSERLRTAGYNTGFCGKWHLSLGARLVFQQTKNVRAGGMPPTVPSSYNRPIDGEDDVWNPFDPQFQGHWTGGTHWAEVLADDAIETIQEFSQKKKPFFGYFAFNSPHDPRQAPKEYVDMYPVETTQIPDNFLPVHPLMDDIGCPKTMRDEMLGPYPRTEHSVQTHRREYYAIISHMDSQLGRIVAAVKAAGQEDNTIIIFSADNGLAIGSHGLFGKQSVYEHSVKVPLVIAGTGIPKGKRIDTPVYMQDLMPTSLELAGVPIPKEVQFKSLVPLMQGKTQTHHDAIYGAFVKHQRMIHKGDYKLMVIPSVKTFYLFDLKNDPSEKRNLADDDDQKERVKSLFADLLELQKTTGDTLDLRVAFADL